MSDKPTKKPAAPKKPAEHPKYIEMVTTAIATLKERNGSSRQAITKYILANYKVSDACSTHIKLALKRGVAAGTLIQPKGTGASGSFKLPKPVPKAKKPAAKKPAAKKPAAKKSTPAKKKPAAKKTAAKKTPTKKKPAKKATSAKKPVAKKAKKPVAKKPAAKKTAKKTPTKKKAAAKK